MGRYAIAAALLCCLVGCGSDSPTSPTSDWIEVVSITPARGTTLTSGATLTITVIASCTIVNSSSGYAVLIISDHADRTLNTPSGTSAIAPLNKGSATVTITDTITVPVSGATVNVQAALFVEGSNRTRAFQRVSFAVQ